jgi:hypothetical protein
MTIRYILCSFGTFFPVLVSCTKKNLATLVEQPSSTDLQQGMFLAAKKIAILPKNVFLKGPFTQSDRFCRTTKNGIDPVCENCGVRHFQMSRNTIFTNVCRIV